jgi:hypothetical protein
LSAVEFAIGGSCERILLFARNTFAFGHGRHTTVVKRDVRFVDTPLVLEAALANTSAEVDQCKWCVNVYVITTALIARGMVCAERKREGG